MWNTVKVSLPHLVANKGGSIILTSSVAGLKGLANSVHYNAAKHGVVGIMRSIGNEFALQGIRVNSVHPTGVNTIMIQNKEVWGLFDPANPDPTRESAAAAFRRGQVHHRRDAAGRRRRDDQVSKKDREKQRDA